MDFYLAAIIQGLGFSMLGMGIFITLKIFSIPDITTDGSYTLGGAVTAVILVNELSPALALLFCFIAGMLAGIATGLIHTKLKVNALLAGILTMTALYSINLAIMGRSNIPLMKTANIMQGNTLIPSGLNEALVVMLICVVFVLIALTFLLKSDFGIAMRVTGDSESMAVAMGVNTTRMKIIGLALANGLTALSAFLITQYQGFADINMGIGIVISGLAAVIIGESILKFLKSDKIFIQLIAVIVGTVLFRVVLALALSFGLNPIYLKLVTAVIVLLIVGIGAVKKRTNID